MPKVSEAHRTARRAHVLDAAARCFSQRGFHRTSMQHIIAAAGMSPGAIYRYFDSKEDIIEAIVDERHAREEQLVAQALDISNTLDALRQLARAYLGWITDADERARRRLSVQTWAEALTNERVRAVIQRGIEQRGLLTALIERGQRSGELRDDVAPDALARVAFALLLGLVLQQAWEPSLDLTELGAAVDALIDGLRGQP